MSTRSLRLSSRSGRVEVVAEARDDVVVERGGSLVEPDVGSPGDGAPLTVSSSSDGLRARVPIGTDVVVGTMSGRVQLDGRFGAVAITTMSGRVEVDTAERVEIRTISGRTEVGESLGETRIDTVSGRVSIRRTVGAWLSTKSGRVTVDAASGPVRARSIAGRIAVTIAGGPIDARLESVSGRIDISVPAGSRPEQRFLARSGSIRSDVPIGDDGSIAARTIGGAIKVTTGG